MDIYKDRVLGKNEKVTINEKGNIKYFNCFAEKKVENMEQLKEFEKIDRIYFKQNLLELAKNKEDVLYILKIYGIWYNFSNFSETIKNKKINFKFFDEIMEEEIKILDLESQRVLMDLFQLIIFGHDEEMKNIKKNFKSLAKILK